MFFIKNVGDYLCIFVCSSAAFAVKKYQAIEKGPKVHALFGLGPQDFGHYASRKQVISKQ